MRSFIITIFVLYNVYETIRNQQKTIINHMHDKNTSNYTCHKQLSKKCHVRCFCIYIYDMQNEPCIDYFYSLKNVSFCAFHPRDHRYLGFITKHPTLQRFACHVFRGNDSTRPVAEGVGRAFQRFYQKFIETAYPIEDIYIE